MTRKKKEKFDPEKMRAIAEEMIASGKMPSPEQFFGAMEELRTEYTGRGDETSKQPRDPIIEELYMMDIPLTRWFYVELIFDPFDPPDPLPAEIEATLPRELQLPQEQAESSTSTQPPDTIVEKLKMFGVPVTRDSYRAMLYATRVPEKLPAELEALLPAELRPKKERKADK